MKKKINQCIALLGVMVLAVGCVNFKTNNEMKKTTENTECVSFTPEELQATYDELKSVYDVLSKRVVRPAEGFLTYPYLIPAGFYKQMWDWDGFFMGNYFISKGKPELMKYWALNLIKGVDEKGYVSGCMTTIGPRPIFGEFSMKPFLAQGVLLASKGLNDFDWTREHYETLKKVIDYREKSQQDSKTGLFFWQIAMQSGADNNPAMNYFQEDTRSYLAPDISALQMREYEAMGTLAQTLGFTDDAAQYRTKAEELKKAINDILWCEDDEIYYTIDRETGEFYRRVSYSSFVPLFGKIASKEQGEAMINRYLIDENHMKSDYGLRSLSKQDVDYNNKNVIIPFSNWQGPVWPVVNYIFAVGLKNYGYDKEVEWIAMVMGKMMIEDYKKWGSLHENYSAEDGSPLAPDDTHVDEDGKFIGFVSWNLCIEMLFQGIVDNNWNLLEVNE